MTDHTIEKDQIIVVVPEVSDDQISVNDAEAQVVDLQANLACCGTS